MSFSITRSLETYAEKAAAMLAHLAGKTLSEIEEACTTPEEIFQQLGSIIAYIEECGEILYSKHQESEELLDAHLATKLINKGILKGKLAFLKNPKDLIKLNLNILFARLGREIMINGPQMSSKDMTTAFIPSTTVSSPSITYKEAIDLIKNNHSVNQKNVPSTGGFSL